MCGIAGFVQKDDCPATGDVKAVLRAMTDTLRHRGPDGEGIAVSGPAAFGHRRLSIIDLATGDQPMANEDGSVMVVFNGEIYNFGELRPELEKRGHRFKTRSDTEVILHAYEEYGDACVERFNGMFAFGLWDGRKRRFFAARDRMGKKPFHYALRGDTLVFGSEIKALLKHPAVRVEITPATLARYLAFGYVPAPETIYDGVRKLPPGHCLEYQGGRLTVRPYWSVEFDRVPLAGLTEDELQRRFLELLQDSVRLRLISDVPLGVFLSGGVDSSAVTAMMCRLMPPKDVKTFTIGFREGRYDESAHARRIARHLGTDHHERTLDEGMMLERLPGLIANLDEPFADSSISPTSLVSEFARTQVTVALGGDGGDELFAGYETFWEDLAASRYGRLPRWLRRGAMEWPLRTGFGLLRLPRLERAVQYLGDAADAPEERRFAAWSEMALSGNVRRGLLERSGRAGDDADVYADVAAYYRSAMGQSRLRRVQHQFQKLYLPDDILAKVDRASMGWSLEVRAPLLDPRVVDFANSLPDPLKLRGRTGKVFLKRALRGLLPEETLERPKMGFGIPLAEWLRGGLRSRVEEVLDARFLVEQGIFRPEPLRRAWGEHLSGRRNHRGMLWTVAAFQLWWREHRPTMRWE